MPALGHRGYLSAVVEDTYGTNPATGYTSEPILSEGLTTKQEYKFIETIRASRQSALQKVPLGRTAGGNLSFNVEVDGIFPMLVRNLMGVDSDYYTTNGDGNGGTHFFGPTDTLDSLSILVNRDTTPDASNIWQYTGCTVDKLTISAKAGDVLTCQATITAQDGQPGAAAADPTYSPENPLIFTQGLVQNQDLESPLSYKCTSCKVDIDTGNLSKRMAIGSPVIQQQQPGVLKVTGELDMYFDNMDAITAFLAGTNWGILLTFTGPLIGDAFYQTVQIYLVNAQFTGSTPTIPAGGKEIMLKMPFTCYYLESDIDEGTPFYINVINNQQSAY